MEKVKQFFTTFFDTNSFSIRKLIIALVIFVAFFILKGLLTTIIIKLFKVKGKENIKTNSFYKPLRILFGAIGIYIAILYLGPTVWFKSLLEKLFRLLVIILCTLGVANIVAPKSKFERTLRKRLTKANDSMVLMICKTLRVIVFLVGGVILISELGYNISGLIAGLGIGGVAIALAAQDTASNIIGALMIILDKPFDVGDWINVEGVEGSVEEFTFRSVRIREAKNSIVSIPNSKVVNSNITNWSRLQKRRILLDLVLEFDTPLKKVADVQNDILIFMDSEEHILKDSTLYCKFSDIKDDGYNLKICAYVDILNYVDYLDYMDKFNFKLMSILHDHKADLAYKSQTIYFKDTNKK